MSSVVINIAISLLTKLADKFFDWAYRIYKLKLLMKQEKEAVDKKAESYNKVLKEINGTGGEPTPEQRQRLIDSARAFIRYGKM